jgi:hypothetical protein
MFFTVMIAPSGSPPAPRQLRNIAAQHRDAPPRSVVRGREHAAVLELVAVHPGVLGKRAITERFRFRAPSSLLARALLGHDGGYVRRISESASASFIVSVCWSRATPPIQRMPVVT